MEANDPDEDIVIIGAGLTGLSLACWLEELSSRNGQAMPRVRLLEPRTTYDNDRTWCFWDREDHPFRQLITHRWPQWQVSAGKTRVVQSSPRTSYALLPADALYRHALHRIEACPALTLQQGVNVETINEGENIIQVITDTVEVRAHAVVDTRPPANLPETTTTGFWQVFTGMEIHCPDHGYEVTTARLMDFQPCDDYPCFVYLLPKDEHHLLVEWTAFQPQRYNQDCEAKLESWLASEGIKDYRVLREESSMLPMIPISSERRSGRVIKAGVGAGWMRAATGYHFATCQRCSMMLAQQILAAKASNRWHLQPPTARSYWLEWMDRVFLRALRRHPDKASEWFLALFSATTGAQMSRFMNDQPCLRDAMAIASALPPGPFLKAALV
ncbi:lycopene cyclase family protein [Vreelandella utahensis]|uniref:lycopene cyclase family protein n=1 Tax=Vreelandella halophila TaxID=86177 RepID=UPI000987712E|nr:lycopene cyclase family protein [Halomonas utahensis]